MCTHSTCDQCGLPPWNRPPHSLVSDPESPDMSCPRRARGGAFLWARYPCRVALQKVTFQARFRAFPLYPSMFACFGTKQVPVDRKNSYGAFFLKITHQKYLHATRYAYRPRLDFLTSNCRDFICMRIVCSKRVEDEMIHPKSCGSF